MVAPIPPLLEITRFEPDSNDDTRRQHRPMTESQAIDACEAER